MPSDHTNDDAVAELRKDNDALRQKLDLIITQNQLAHAQQKPDDPKSGPWYTTLIQFLALPAAVLALYIQWDQATSPIQETKTIAETEKIRTEELRARAELEKLLGELEKRARPSSGTGNVELEASISRVENALQNINRIQQTTQTTQFLFVFSQYIFIWALFHVAGLLFDIIS